MPAPKKTTAKPKAKVATKAKPKVAPKPKAKTTTKAKPKVTAKPKVATKPKAKVTPKPKPKPKTRAKVVAKPQVEKPVINIEEEFPHDMFPWKLIFKDGTEKRTCYFQCEEHRKKHITRYNLNKKNILFMGYKFDE